MKLRVFVALIILTGLITGCGVYTMQNLKPSDAQSFVGKDGGFLYGTYTFTDNTYFMNANVVLITGIEGKDQKEFYIDMREQNGYFLYFLKPGTYKISMMEYRDLWGRAVIDNQLLHSTFTIQPNQITYLGSFSTTADYDKTYIHWGIKSVADNADADIAAIKKLDPALNDLAVMNDALKGTHSIVDLLYLPGSKPTDKDKKMN